MHIPSSASRSLPGTQSYAASTYSAASSSGWSSVSRVFALRALLLAAALAAFTLITALVLVGGYVTTCDELHYETKRQLYGRTTLGETIKNR